MRKTTSKKRPQAGRAKRVDKGLLEAAQNQLQSIKAKVKKSRVAFEQDPIKAISETVLENLKKMKVFANMGKAKSKPASNAAPTPSAGKKKKSKR